MRYIALLRGINISGKNKITMSDLKTGFMDLGFSNVVTLLNSGNVAFSSELNNEDSFSKIIRNMIEQKFSLNIPVFVINQMKIKNILENAPLWWGTENSDIYDNLIFVIPPAQADEVSGKIGEPTKNMEQVHTYENYIFWSFDRKNYSKLNWWKKTSTVGITEMLTIRTANTVKKLVKL